MIYNLNCNYELPSQTYIKLLPGSVTTEATTYPKFTDHERIEAILSEFFQSETTSLSHDGITALFSKYCRIVYLTDGYITGGYCIRKSCSILKQNLLMDTKLMDRPGSKDNLSPPV